MPRIPFFKDLSKRASDLLTKDFPSEKQENKFEWKGTTDGGVTIESSILQKSDGSYLGTFGEKYKVKEYGTTFSGEVNTKKEAKLEVAMEDYHLAGLKTTLTGNYKPDEKFATFGVDYQHETSGNLSVSVDYGKALGSTLKGSAVVGYENYTLGGSAEYLLANNADNSELKDIQTSIGYAGTSSDITIFGRMKAADPKAKIEKDRDEKNTVGVSFYHKFAPDWTVGGEASFEMLPPSDKNAAKLTLGTQYRVTDDTTVKTKFDTQGKVGLSLAQRYNRYTRFIISSTFDTADKHTAQFGFTVSMSDS